MGDISRDSTSGLYQQNPGIETAPLQDEVILFHPSTAKFFVLNRTSSFIWSHLQHPASAAEIAEKLSANFKKSNEFDITVDVHKVLDEMHSQGLVTKVQDGNGNNKSRRVENG